MKQNLNESNNELSTLTRRIAVHYGRENQLGKLEEELTEALEALRAFREEETKNNLLHLAEELADVRIMSDQVMFLHGMEDAELTFRSLKVARQISRMGATPSDIAEEATAYFLKKDAASL